MEYVLDNVCWKTLFASANVLCCKLQVVRRKILLYQFRGLVIYYQNLSGLKRIICGSVVSGFFESSGSSPTSQYAPNFF